MTFPARSLVATLALAALAIPLSAQRVEKDRRAGSPTGDPEPAARADTSYFAVVLNADTLAGETVIRAATTLSGDLRLLQPRMMAVQYRMFVRPDGTVDSMHTTTVDGSVAARGTIVIRADSAVLTMIAPGLAQPQVSRIAVRPGTVPFINLSAGALDQIFRRARVLGGDTVHVPLLTGPQMVTGRVQRVGPDSATLDLGVELRAALERDGAFRGAVVPAQNVRFVRVPPPKSRAGPARRAQSDADRYAAPPGAPYTAEQVSIRTADGGMLAGTLTLPRGAGADRPAPVVVTISGSGLQNRDSELVGIGGYAIFREVADTLGRRGIGVLRLDDRGAGASSPAPAEMTSETTAGDIRTVLAWLRARPEVDGARLGLLGHSEGAIIAPMVATEDSSVRAVALLAGPSRPGAELSAHQRRVTLEQDPRVPVARRDSIFRRAQAEADSLVTTGTANAWMRFWWTYDPGPALRRLRAPVLVLHGETDMQVPVAQAEETAALLRAGGNADVTLRRFPAVNHLFLADPSGHWAGYAALPSKAVPDVILGTVADWFAARLGR